jgi:hypothetical protein
MSKFRYDLRHLFQLVKRFCKKPYCNLWVREILENINIILLRNLSENQSRGLKFWECIGKIRFGH